MSAQHKHFFDAGFQHCHGESKHSDRALEVLQHTLFFYKRFLLFESLIRRLERLEDDEESKAASSRFLLTRHRYISLKTV